MTRLLRRRAATATERLQRLDRHAGTTAMLEAAHDPSVDIARRALGWLAHDGGPVEREALRGLVWTCDPMLVLDAAQTLRALGDRETVDAALERLGAAPTAERCRAARVLERFADPRARAALCEALTDEDASVRAAVLDALARLGHDNRAARAAARLVTDANGEVRRRAVRAVGRVSRHPAEAIRPALRDPLAIVRREAASLASLLQDADLAVLLGDHDPHVRAAAAASAGRASEAALVTALHSDPHPVVRLAAAHTLGLLGGQGAGAALIAAALDDAEATVRACALRLANETLARSRLVAALRTELVVGSGPRRAMALRAHAKLSVGISQAEALVVARDPDPGVRLALAHVATAIVEPPDGLLSALAIDDDATVRHVAAILRERQRQ